MITLVHRHIGTVTLDAVIEETHQAELRITENPVESGAMIGDHAVLMPQTVTIAGIVVDYQPQRSPAPAAEEHRAEPLRLLTDRVPFPTDLLPFTAQALRVAQRELPSVISQATAPQSDGQHAVRPLADWLPDFQPITPRDDSAATGRIAQVYTALRNLQRSGQTLEVQTGVQKYQDMLILSIAARQTQDGSIEFVLTVRELFIVKTTSISGVSLPAPKRGRSASQGAAQRHSGQTHPKPVDTEKNRSLLRQISGLF
ncbi:hypothetical protein LOK82_10795 [Xylella fastidiosa subsp. multiplex]|uniref:Dit-like phage tail protein N-terminal domain-containing protein n=8 Tax=Xylella fastidiosa TaxID=2371 RepID=A0AAW6HWG2_XYLFS|nr:hypothetical protein [Xylella fastidiosa subsp. multiplex]